MYFYTKVSSANISPTARTVYRAMLHYANRKTWLCFPSVKTIARDTGLTTRTIRRILGDIEKEGLIIKIHRTRQNNGDMSNMYFFN